MPQQPQNNYNPIIFIYKLLDNDLRDEQYYTIENLQTAFLQENSILQKLIKVNIISNDNLRSLFIWAFQQYCQLKQKLQSEIQTINDRIHILESYQQNIEQEKINSYYKEKINNLQNDLEQKQQLLNYQYNRNKEIQDSYKQLQNQLKENQNQLQQIIFQQQLQISENESLRIQEVKQYKKEIKILNSSKKNLKQIIQNSKQYSSQNQENQIIQLHEIEDQNFQQIQNLIKQFIIQLKNTEDKQVILKQKIAQDFDINKDKNQNIQILIEQLDKNNITFNGIINLFEKIIKSMQKFQTINQQLNIYNKQLSENLNEEKQKINQSNQQIEQLLAKSESQSLLKLQKKYEQIEKDVQSNLELIQQRNLKAKGNKELIEKVLVQFNFKYYKDQQKQLYFKILLFYIRN